MRKKNEIIELTGGEAIIILKEIEYIMMSLRNIGRYYHDPGVDHADASLGYALETTRFIDDGKVTHRLSMLRKIISEKFDRSLDEDDMDDIERAVEEVMVWKKPGD